MKAFLRDNPTIAFGLGLPLLLVVVFLLFSGLPAVWVPPPQYDVLYATNYDTYNPRVMLNVVGQKVEATCTNTGYSVLRLWRYSGKTGAVSEIIINCPNPPPNQDPKLAGAAGWQPISVAGLEGLKVDPASISPDGYEFRASDNRNEFSSVFLFGGGYRDRYPILLKDGYKIRLNAPDVYGYNTRFIGWIIP